MGTPGMQQWNRVMQASHGTTIAAAAVDALYPQLPCCDKIWEPSSRQQNTLSKFAALNPLENLKLTKPFQSILNQVDIPSGGFTC
jgi:hypothetical protein